MKILLVDDADVFQQSVANLLRTRGHEVIEAENGLTGLKLARTHLPDVIVSDIVMSQVDGYVMTALLRQHPTTADIPLLLITGEADLKGIRKGMTLGADDYIAKPFKMDELVAALELRVHRRSRSTPSSTHHGRLPPPLRRPPPRNSARLPKLSPPPACAKASPPTPELSWRRKPGSAPRPAIARATSN